MENELIKYYAAYLPYGVKVQDCLYPETEWTLHYYRDALDTLADNEHISLFQLLKENETDTHKLKLRPLSDITNDIEHDDFSFIPIVYLLKEATRQIWGEEIVLIEKPEIHCYNESAGIIAYNDTERVSLTVDVTDIRKEFELRIDGGQMMLDQVKLFNKLFEWHFDVFGLIEKGLAVPLT